jgi:hypothetical protein
MLCPTKLICLSEEKQIDRDYSMRILINKIILIIIVGVINAYPLFYFLNL